MEVTSMHLGQRVSCNCNVTDSLLISAPLASDALLLRCCPQLLPASSLPFPPYSMPSGMAAAAGSLSCWPAHLPFFLSSPSLHPSLLLIFFVVET